MRFKLVLMIVLLTGFVLLKTGRTDADLIAERRQQNNSFAATTLSFSNRNTANFDAVTWFFTTDHLKPDGYDVRALKVQRDGKMDFNYTIQAQKKSGDDALCNALELTVMKDWQEVYKGNLFTPNIKRSLAGGGSDDLVFVIKLTKNDVSLRQKQCDFSFEMHTYKNSPDEPEKGLYARQELQNSIKTGIW